MSQLAISIPRWTTYGSYTLHCALYGFSDTTTVAFAAKSKVAPLKTISVSIGIIRCSAFRSLDAFRAFSSSTSETRVLLLDGLHHYTRLAELITFPMENLLLPIAFRLCNHSFLKFHSVMFRRTPIPRTARLVVSLPIFSHAIWWSGPPWLHHPPESCPSVSSDVLLEQRSEPPICALHTMPNWDLALRYSLK